MADNVLLIGIILEEILLSAGQRDEKSDLCLGHRLFDIIVMLGD